jgi:hypothetical protein
LCYSRLGHAHTTHHRIELTPGAKPIHSHPYRAGPRAREVEAAEVQRMLKAGVIEPSTTEWASLMKKPDVNASLDEARCMVARSLPPGSPNQAHKRWVARVQQSSTRSAACNRKICFCGWRSSLPGPTLYDVHARLCVK